MIRAPRLALALLSCLGLAAGQAAQDPKDLLKGIKAPPGFEVTLFGAPPEVGYPTCLSAAPNGELYVGVDENGSLDAKPGRGRVLRCVDADGDGRADRIGVFAKMDSPRGIVWDDGVLYVQHPPLVTAFHDDDRDGAADRSEVLVKGLGFDLKFRGADHTTNGMRLGIDGWLYIAVGDYGFVKAAGRDGTELQLHGGGVVRVRTDGSGLELYTQGQRNIYDVAVDPFLNAFTRDNTNDGGGWDVRLSHLVPTAHFGYPSLFKNFGEEIVRPLADYGGGSPCGAIFLDEPGLPGGLYTCEWGRSAVYHHPLTPDGAGFKAEQKGFVEIQRPTDMDVDGRSQVYIASWKNGNFNYSGPNVGFVARVARAGAKPPAFPDLRKATDEQLVKTVSSPSQVARLAAQREILRRGNKAISIDVAPGDPLAGRVAALFTLSQLRGELAFDRLQQLALDKDLAEFALRALADRKSDRVPTGLFVKALGDAEPRVRLQAAVGLGRLGRKEAAPDLVKLLSDPDPLVVHVIVNTLVSLRASEACLAALDAGDPRACRVLQALHETAVVDGLLGRLVRATDPAPILKALCRLYNREAPWDGKWWGTRPDTTGPYYNPVKWEGSERIGKALSSALGGAKPEALRPLLVDLQKCRVDLPEAEPLVLKLAAQDPSFRPVAVEMLARRNPLPAAAVELFAAVAVSDKEPVALRARAVRALVRSGAAPDAVVRALARPDGELQPVWEEFVRDGRHAQDVERFAALALSERSEVAFGVLARLANAKGTPGEAKAAASRAVERAWSQADLLVPLLRAVGRARENAYAFQVLTFAKDARPDVKKAAAYAAEQLGLNKVSQGTPIGKLPYEQIAAEAAKEKGDPKHGAALYARQGCGACHTVSTDESPKGPFLGGIATRYSRAELIESILKPSAKIAQGFETQGFKLSNDDVIEGFVARESGDEVEVRTVQGTATVIPKKGLQARVRRELSVMPTGLADTLTTGDLASLLAYLESLKSK